MAQKEIIEWSDDKPINKHIKPIDSNVSDKQEEKSPSIFEEMTKKQICQMAEEKLKCRLDDRLNKELLIEAYINAEKAFGKE